MFVFNCAYVSMWSVYLSIGRRLLFKYLKNHDSWLVWMSKQMKLNVIIVIHHLKYILSRVDKAIWIIHSRTGSLFTLSLKLNLSIEGYPTRIFSFEQYEPIQWLDYVIAVFSNKAMCRGILFYYMLFIKMFIISLVPVPFVAAMIWFINHDVILNIIV